MNGRNTRIATVTDDSHPLFGQVFVVQQWRDQVHCWGQVSTFRGGRRRHQGSLSFASEQVKVEEIADSGQALSRKLFDQYIADVRRRGGRVYQTRTTYEITRAPLSDAAVAVAAELEIDPRHASDAELDEIVALAKEL